MDYSLRRVESHFVQVPAESAQSSHSNTAMYKGVAKFGDCSSKLRCRGLAPIRKRCFVLAYVRAADVAAFIAFVASS